MQIKSLRLENFQSYKDITIDFHPNFNCLVGVGNSGKTSLIRALSFLFYNQWDTSWVRYNEKFCRITLTTDSGIVVVREKGEKDNRFILRLPNQKEQVYENFGLEIPIDIQKVFQVFKVQVDTKEFLNLNVSSQLEPLFLLSKPGSFRAKVFGKLSGAHILDYVLRDLNKDKRNLSVEKTLKLTEKIELQKQLIDFEGLNKEKEVLDSISLKIDQVTRKLEVVSTLKTLFLKTQQWKGQYTLTLDEKDKVSHVPLEKAEKLTEVMTKLNALRVLNLKLVENKRKRSDCATEIVHLEWLSDKQVSTYVTLLMNAKKCPTCFSSINDTQMEEVKKTLR